MHREALRETGNMLVRGEVGYCEILARAEQARLIKLSGAAHSEVLAKSIMPIGPLLAGIRRKLIHLRRYLQKQIDNTQPTWVEQQKQTH